MGEQATGLGSIAATEQPVSPMCSLVPYFTSALLPVTPSRSPPPPPLSHHTASHSYMYVGTQVHVLDTPSSDKAKPRQLYYY